MTLRHIDSQEPWNPKEPIGGIRYPRAIATSWTVEELADIGLEHKPVPEPQPPAPATQLEKAELIRRMTSEEVGNMLAALDAHSDPKMAELYRATTVFDQAAEEYPVLEAAFIAVLGAERAAIVLEAQF